MRAVDVGDLQRELAARGLDWCLVGGWGVDALLGEQTRPHKDLDVLIPLQSVDGILSLLADQGFRLAHLWEENRFLDGNHRLVGEPLPSAFVLDHDDGRQVDAHVYETRREKIVNLWETERVLHPGDLAVTGIVDGIAVRCMSAETQLVCHQGYELPQAHAEDVRRLQRFVGSAPVA